MLQALRTKLHGWPSIVILGICVFAISFFGIESYFASHTETYVAMVGKHEISQRDFQDRMNEARRDAMARMGDSFDAAQFEQPEMKRRILDQLINEQLLRQANDALGMKVPDIALRDRIAGTPQFQVNGQFDPTTYRAILAAQNMTPAMFEASQRASLEPGLVPRAIIDSAIVTEADMDRYLGLLYQRRDLRWFAVPRPALSDSAVSDAQLEAYYKAHQADFMNPEQVSLKYIEVNGADLKIDAQPSDDELKKRYEEQKQRFVQPEQRLVSHILVNVPKNATPDQQKAALAKAEKIAGEAKPDNFAKLAEQDSDDLGSKRSGGDLGWLEKGVTNAAFDSALFSLQKGQISKPVLSDEGYHVLFLRDVRSGEAKPFAEVRDQIAKDYLSTERDRQYSELAGKLTDQTYQNPSSLEPASQALNLPIQTTALFPRKGGEGIAANAKLVQAAFSDDVLVQGNNSGLIELGPDHAVVVRVDKHVPAAARPLAEVRDQVRQKILDERIAAEALKNADALLAKVQKGEDMQAVASAAGAAVQAVPNAVRMQQGVAPEVLEQAFLLPHPAEGKPQFARVSTADGNYALVAVDKVQEGDLSKVTFEQRDALRSQMAQAYGILATQAFIDALKAKTDIKIAADRM
ncbi:SurA N-terminal domain-containing protein [Dyella jiangningensis]|uniref:SurA N-terminal domain-containing protein n=1 Tax=Dyella jiangningensis TaxID=1379159 RepID=UPI00240F519F|nr:SurA N-terminal domain-containing protein [Dyella jiangningensis]MDG2536731.1 SurA N-terminal domain-containing protein [Dyella jiangningensis]